MKSLLANLLIVFAVLLVFGWIRWIPESKLNAELHEKRLLPKPIEWEERNSMGQAGFAAALGGLRPVLASYFYLRAHNLHVARDWYEMEKTYNTITTLQPYSEFYWEMAGWQLANNTSSLERDNIKVEPIERERRRRDYIQRGDKYYQKGLEILPNSYKLLSARQLLMTDTFRVPNFEEAVKVGEQLLKAEGLTHNQRLLGWGNYLYALAAIPGREAEAYEQAKALWDFSTPGQRVPTLKTLIYVLENSLNIPLDQRMDEAVLFTDTTHLFALMNQHSKDLHQIKNNSKDQNIAFLTELKQAWKYRTSKKSLRLPDNFLRAKIYAIQAKLEPYLTQIPNSELTYSESHRQYLEDLSNLNHYMVERSKNIEQSRDELLKKFRDGNATRFEKLILFSLQYNILRDASLEKELTAEALLYHNEMKYNRLKMYWNAVNDYRSSAISRHNDTLQFKPTEGVLREIFLLEKLLNVAKGQRIKMNEVYTGQPF